MSAHPALQTHEAISLIIKETEEGRQCSSGWVAQLVRTSSLYPEVGGSIPGQGTCKKKPTTA